MNNVVKMHLKGYIHGWQEMQIYGAEKGNRWINMYAFLICLMFHELGIFLYLRLWDDFP